VGIRTVFTIARAYILLTQEQSFRHSCLSITKANFNSICRRGCEAFLLASKRLFGKRTLGNTLEENQTANLGKRKLKNAQIQPPLGASKQVFLSKRH